jgi:hypothetical protein
VEAVGGSRKRCENVDPCRRRASLGDERDDVQFHGSWGEAGSLGSSTL